MRILHVATSLDKDFLSIFGIIVTHSKPLSYYKLEWGTSCPFALGHPIVNGQFRYHSSAGILGKMFTEYLSRKKLDSHNSIRD